MHADELEIDEPLVRGLLAAQFPQWADLPLAPVASGGTDNAIYRLGDELSVRLPRVDWATAQAEKEHLWLPRLAPRLPLAIQEPLALGEPAEGYPWRWSVCRWLPGQSALDAPCSRSGEAAVALAEFIVTLRQVEPADGPAAGTHNFHRGVPLAERDAGVRRAIEGLRDEDGIDVDRLSAAWEAALAVPPWDQAPAWIHGDLGPGNLIVHQGRLSGVIDFGCLGVGDPATDAMAAWTVFDAGAREVFRRALEVDQATWDRGRGWALTWIGALPYYRDTNPIIVATARRAIAEVLAEHGA